MKKFKFIFILIFIIILTGCDFIKNDTMEDIEIITTNYSLEYITRYLYGDKSLITSIYPDGVNIKEYKLTKKQIEDYSKKDLFIYIGNSHDSETAINIVEKNKDILLINSTLGMKYTNSIEELWLNPSNIIMIAQNVKTDLVQYISNSYLINDIEEKYTELKLALSELDAEYKLTVQNADNQTIYTNSSALKYLEKYGLTVYVLDENLDIYEKNLNILKGNIQKSNVKNIFILENTTIPSEIQNLIDDNKITMLTYRCLDNITDEERDNGQNYLTLSRKNLETLKEELYN